MIRFWRPFAFHVGQTLKYLEAIFDDIPSLARLRPAPAVRSRAPIDLDEDLFSPAGGAAQSPPRDRAALPSVDLDDRPWPTLETPPKAGPHALEKKAAEQERELALRCTQVADLYNLQERQSAELQVAYAEIERLTTAFNDLQETATQHALSAAERKKAVTALHQENAVLRSKLDKAMDDATELSQQMLTTETMFNDRELVITTALEKADLLKAELAAAAEEKSQLTVAMREAEQLHRDDVSRKMAAIDELNRKVESLFADHSVQLKTREKLAKRCDELAKSAAALETENQEAKVKLAAQAEHAAFLETVLRVERETAEARIKELTERLEHERSQRASADRASSAMRLEMAALLRQFTARRRQAGDGDPEVPAPRQDAA
ncbi:MAG: hypothetical protein Q8M24_10950 [Pseudolabrys sp.]|nr:hypothetical protein [Pseudolabrys sp.]MDP2295965.1 hypothetical protein [Pseudolabrys sp.]